MNIQININFSNNYYSGKIMKKELKVRKEKYKEKEESELEKLK